MKNLITIEEASQYLRLPINSLYKYTSQRKIPFVKFGKRILFDQSLLDHWLDKHIQKTEDQIINSAKYNFLKSTN